MSPYPSVSNSVVFTIVVVQVQLKFGYSVKLGVCMCNMKTQQGKSVKGLYPPVEPGNSFTLSFPIEILNPFRLVSLSLRLPHSIIQLDNSILVLISFQLLHLI